MRILITGAAGFVGHHLLEYLFHNTPDDFVLIDRLDHSGTLHRIDESRQANPAEFNRRVKFIWHDLRAPLNEHVCAQIGDIDQVYHLAAGSHVDRSIVDPMSFVMDNVVGTTNLLLWARDHGKPLFLYASTDEVFGPAYGDTRYKEWDRYHSGNPYAATKAGAEQMCLAFRNTYQMRVRIVNTMNVIGERQSPEKFVPSTIRKVLAGEKVLIHADSLKIRAGSRYYIHAIDVARAMRIVMQNDGHLGFKFNIVGERELDNLELAQMIAAAVSGDEYELNYELVDFHSSRPGHDLRYALDGHLLACLGFVHTKPIAEHIESIVKWTLDNKRWLS